MGSLLAFDLRKDPDPLLPGDNVGDLRIFTIIVRPRRQKIGAEFTTQLTQQTFMYCGSLPAGSP